MSSCDSFIKRLFRYFEKRIAKLRLGFYDKKLFCSQYGQDYFILKYFKFKKEGFFIDIGAFDGISLSNTKYLETLGWSGICVEPNPEIFEKMSSIRKCAKYNAAIAEVDSKKNFAKISGSCATLSGIKDDYNEKHLERIKKELKETGGSIDTIEVQTITFDTLMEDFKDIKIIDYISIDTEGNEFKILKSIDFLKYDIKTLSIENNYEDAEIQKFMEKTGYKRAIKLGCDEIYIKK